METTKLFDGWRGSGEAGDVGELITYILNVSPFHEILAPSSFHLLAFIHTHTHTLSLSLSLLLSLSPYLYLYLYI